MELSDSLLKNLKELKEKVSHVVNFDIIDFLDDGHFISIKEGHDWGLGNDGYYDNHYEYSVIEKQTILKLLNETTCSFQQIVDRLKTMGEFSTLLRNKKFFEELIENNKLSTNDLRSLLNTVDKIYEIRSLSENIPLIKKILNEFVLDKELVDKFNTIIEEDEWCKKEDVRNIFELIEFFATHEHNEEEDWWYPKALKDIDKELLELNELNRKVYLLNSFELTKDQKLEISEVLRDNEQSQSLLIQIVENHLEDQYDFETLKNTITKEDKKKLKTKFNF